MRPIVASVSVALVLAAPAAASPHHNHWQLQPQLRPTAALLGSASMSARPPARPPVGPLVHASWVEPGGQVKKAHEHVRILSAHWAR